MNDNIEKAYRVLADRKIIIFPTDTAFGIGCLATEGDAVKKVFDIRKRPHTQAVPVLFSSVEMLREYVLEFPREVQDLTDKYWPGALTVILPANMKKIPSIVTGGGASVGVRIPRHNDAIALIEKLGSPIIAPSANFHGDPTPFKLSDLNPNLINLIDYVLPGVCTLKKESTVIDCTHLPWKIIRQGAVEI